MPRCLTFPSARFALGLPHHWFSRRSPNVRAGASGAAERWAASGVIQPVRVVVQLRKGKSALSGRPSRGSKALNPDSIPEGPAWCAKVRGVPRAQVENVYASARLVITSDAPQVRAKKTRTSSTPISAPTIASRCST